MPIAEMTIGYSRASTLPPKAIAADDHGGAGALCTGAEEVSTHTGDVTDVIANVVSDNGRVTRIVFRNSRLDLANEVGANIGCFREDTAAHAREQRDGRTAKAEAGNHFHQYVRWQIVRHYIFEAEVDQQHAERG